MYLLTALCHHQKDLPYAIQSNQSWGQTCPAQFHAYTLVSAHVVTFKYMACSWHLCCVELSTPGLCH